MRAFLIIMICMTCVLPLGCSQGSSPTGKASPQGAWLGEGEFQASAGSTTVKAQLEILNDGTYRFLILEPRVLMLAGMEKGHWTESNGALRLAPDEALSSERQLSVLAPQAPRNFRPKTLTISPGYTSLRIEDGQWKATFLPNEEPTTKLREKGEID